MAILKGIFGGSGGGGEVGPAGPQGPQGETGPAGADGADGAQGAPTVQNVAYAIKTNLFSTNSTSWVNITDLSATITSSKDNPKMLISACLGVSPTSNNGYQYISLWRKIGLGSWTQIAKGDAQTNCNECWFDASTGKHSGTTSNVYSNVPRNHSGEYVDDLNGLANDGDSVEYKLMTKRTIGSTYYIGRSSNTSDGNRSTIPSTLIVKEIIE